MVLEVVVDMMVENPLERLLHLQMEDHLPFKVMQVDQELLVIQALQMVLVAVVLVELVLHLHIPAILEALVV